MVISRLLMALLFVFAASLWPHSVGAEDGKAVWNVQPRSSQEIEADIAALADPSDHDRLSVLFFQLASVEDATARDRLQQRLDERLNALWKQAMGEPGVPVAGVPAPAMPESAEAVVDPEMLRFEIRTMSFGPDATAEELRQRDALFERIAGIEDPALRYELLELFRAYERGQDEGERLIPGRQAEAVAAQ